MCRANSFPHMVDTLGRMEPGRTHLYAFKFVVPLLQPILAILRHVGARFAGARQWLLGLEQLYLTVDLVEQHLALLLDVDVWQQLGVV